MYNAKHNYRYIFFINDEGMLDSYPVHCLGRYPENRLGITSFFKGEKYSRQIIGMKDYMHATLELICNAIEEGEICRQDGEKAFLKRIDFDLETKDINLLVKIFRRLLLLQCPYNRKEERSLYADYIRLQVRVINVVLDRIVLLCEEDNIFFNLQDVIESNKNFDFFIKSKKLTEINIRNTLENFNKRLI